MNRPSNAAPKTQTTSLSAELSLKVSAYDRVASLLVALLVILGILVLAMTIVWFTGRIFASQTSVPVVMQEIGGGREDGVVGESMQIDAPDAQEIGLETDLTEPALEDTLALIVDAVAERQADLDDPAITEELESSGGGSLQGDGRQIGKGFGDGAPGIGRAQRWEVRFDEGGTLDNYARQLDFFNIELGVVGSTDQVQYAYNLAEATPAVRTANRADEGRLYMAWRRGQLQQADRQLLDRAGVPYGRSLVLQFYPQEVENRLAQLEQQFAGREASQIAKTVFGVRSSGRGFEFYVLEQTPL